MIISAKYDCQDVSIQAACFPKPLVAGLTRPPKLAPTPSILYNIFIGSRPVLHVVYQLESQRCFLWADLIVGLLPWFTGGAGGLRAYKAHYAHDAAHSIVTAIISE